MSHLQPHCHSRTVLSFDVEEHYRIEAASHLDCSTSDKRSYLHRAERTTRELLKLLNETKTVATFFIVGELASSCPSLIREIHDAGHEVASHGWDHQSVLKMTQASFRNDIRKSKDTLEQLISAPIFGYRAPTFSIVPQTAWAIDELIEADYEYDSSIFPVRHDRYGVPQAPTVPFWCSGHNPSKKLLEIPPLTLRTPFTNLPIAGGGYFRLFPLPVMQAGMILNRYHKPSVSMLYFHPWEFDPGQTKLPLRSVSRLRTYAGIHRSAARLRQLIHSVPNASFCRAKDIIQQMQTMPLVHFKLASNQ